MAIQCGMTSHSCTFGTIDTIPSSNEPMTSARSVVALWTLLLAAAPAARAQQALPAPQSAASQPAEAQQAQPTADWRFGGFVDVAYLGDSNSPANHLFRTRSTTPRVDELDLNMTAAYVRKSPSEASRGGLELTVQTGRDSETFGFSPTAPNIAGADGLRHLGPTSVSYLAPVGKGLTVQAGIFTSLIGYDSLYAKDNLNYTRPWGADNTPYLMLGVNASYPVTSRLTLTGFLINSYWHLAYANYVPSSGAQLAYTPSDHVTVKETVLYGPQQADTSLSHWRVFSDSIIERKSRRLITAFEYQLGTENVASLGDQRAWWMAAQFPVNWIVHGPFGATIRPEVAWDSQGRWTGFVQTIGAVTATLQYRVPYRQAQAIVRLEYRYDNSRGPGGGFFKGVGPGVDVLTPGQSLFGVGVILAFDGAFHP
jgi:hypothetical protein